MTLEQWQARLEAHFRKLASERSTGDWPVFALEHGLSASELDDLSAQVRKGARNAVNSNSYLPWVVYAAEAGYRYSGWEYWQSFEENTPGWEGSAPRNWMRRSYIKFAKTFGGAELQGKWADWFSIIAWPITHAILPLDLQLQLVGL